MSDPKTAAAHNAQLTGAVTEPAAATPVLQKFETNISMQPDSYAFILKRMSCEMCGEAYYYYSHRYQYAPPRFCPMCGRRNGK